MLPAASPDYQVDFGAAQGERGLALRDSSGRKSFLACTWTLQAYRDGFSALYTRLPQVLRDLRCYRNSA